MGPRGQFAPGKPLAGPVRPGPVVSARLHELEVGRVFFKGEAGSSFALFENADRQAFMDPTGRVLGFVDCPRFGRGALLGMPFTRPGAKPGTMPTKCAKRGSRAVMLIELLKPLSAFVEGILTVTPKLLDRNGAPVTSSLSVVNESFKGDTPPREFLVEVDLGVLPDLVGLYILELAFDAAPGAAKFHFTPVKSQQFVVLTLREPVDPTNDTATTVTDTVSGTAHRMGKLMARLPNFTSDEEEILWLLHASINDGNPPQFFNRLGVELTHNGEIKKHFDGTGIAGSGNPLPLTEQWLALAPAGAKPFNRAACAGYVQLLKTMAATLGINVQRTLVLPCTGTLPGGKAVSPKREAPMTIAPAGLDVFPHLQVVELRDPDGTLHQAHPALIEPNQSGEFFEACAVTPAGKFLPGGFAISRLKANGVPNWDKGPSGKKMGGGFAKAQRGFDSATDVLNWWTNVKTRDGFQRFMCWVVIEGGDLKFCWDRDGKAFRAKDVEKIRDTGKALLPP